MFSYYTTHNTSSFPRDWNTTNESQLNLTFISKFLDIEYSRFINLAVSVERNYKNFQNFLESQNRAQQSQGLKCLKVEKTHTQKKFKKLRKSRTLIFRLKKLVATGLLKKLENSNITVERANDVIFINPY